MLSDRQDVIEQGKVWVWNETNKNKDHQRSKFRKEEEFCSNLNNQVELCIQELEKQDSGVEEKKDRLENHSNKRVWTISKGCTEKSSDEWNLETT